MPFETTYTTTRYVHEPVTTTTTVEYEYPSYRYYPSYYPTYYRSYYYPYYYPYSYRYYPYTTYTAPETTVVTRTYSADRIRYYSPARVERTTTYHTPTGSRTYTTYL